MKCWTFAAVLIGLAASCLPILPESCGQENALSADAANITADRIAAHIRFLADDLLEGRGPGTRGDRLTQLYISTEFQRMGLMAKGENGGWTQAVPLVGVTTNQPPTMTFQGSNSSIELKQSDDYIAVSGVAEPIVEVPSSEIIFVGYGITAPEYDWDDYQNLDVRDKIVMVMNNDPEDDPNLFGGHRRLYYGRWDYKYANAAAHGAAGAIIIHTEESAGYPYSVVQTSWSGEESELREDKSPRVKLKAWVTEAAAKRICELGKKNLDDLRSAANSREFKAVPLGVSTQTKLESAITQLDTANVLGALPGSDPKKADEYVIVMAHHDHLGLATERDASGDDIYNGAIDNASGTAAMLAIAEAFASSKQRPARSLIFAAVGAEEQGLLGSKYFAAHPAVPSGKMAGLINMDSMNHLGRTLDIQVVGHGKSSLDAVIGEVAALQNRKVVPDQFIDRGYFYRSDQFSLAKIGVPGLYLHAGTAVRGKADEWGRVKLDFWTKTIYHQPSDEYDPDWDFSGMVEDAQLLFEITKRVANADQMQSWNPGDEFEAARKAAIARESNGH